MGGGGMGAMPGGMGGAPGGGWGGGMGARPAPSPQQIQAFRAAMQQRMAGGQGQIPGPPGMQRPMGAPGGAPGGGMPPPQGGWGAPGAGAGLQPMRASGGRISEKYGAGGGMGRLGKTRREGHGRTELPA